MYRAHPLHDTGTVVLSKMVAIMFCVSPIFPDNEPLEGCARVFFSSAPQTQMVPGTQVIFFSEPLTK